MANKLMSEMTDEEFKAATSAPTPQQAAQSGMGMLEVPDATYQKMTSPDPAINSKPENQFDPIGETIKYVHGLGDKLQSGEAGIARSNIGFSALVGQTTYEESRHDANIENLKEIQKKTGSFDAQYAAYDPRRWIGNFTESLPFMRETIGGGVAGAAGGAALGAAAGLAGGPLAEVTVPGGAAAGASWGFRAGEFGVTSKLSAGGLYMDLRDAGIDEGTAKVSSVAGGAVMGFIQTARVGQLTSIARKAFLQQLVSESGQATAQSFMKTYAKEVGIQITQQELSKATEILTRVTASIVDKNPGAMPSQEQIQKELVDTFVNSAGVAAVAVPAFHAAGSLPGKAVGTVQGRVMESPSLTGAMEHLQQGWADKPPTLEQAQVVESMTPGQILDKVLTPLTDNQGNLTEQARMEPVKAGIEQTQIPDTIRLYRGEVEGRSASQGQHTYWTTDKKVAESFGKNGKVLTEDVAFDNLYETDNLGTAKVELGLPTETHVVDVLDAIRAQGYDGVSWKGAYGPEFIRLGDSPQKLIGQVGGDFKFIDNPVVDEPLPGAPSVEVQGRIRQVESDMQIASKEISTLEAEFIKRDTANTRILALKGQIEELSNQQKADAAHIAQLNKDILGKEKSGKDTANIIKTLDQIGNRQEATFNKLQRAKAELGELEHNPTTSITNKLEKLYAQFDKMDEELAGLKYGMFEPQDLKGLDIKVKADKILALRARAAKESLRNFNRGVKEGVQYTKEEVKNAQTHLVALLRDSGLEGKDQAKFLAKLKAVQTSEQLQRALPEIQRRINALIEKGAVLEGRASVERLLKQARLKKNGQFAEGKYDAGTQDVLGKFNKFIKEPEARDAAYAAFEAGETPITAEDYAIARLTDGYLEKTMSSRDLESLRSELEHVILEGKTRIAVKRENEQTRIAEIRAKGIEEINGNKPFTEKQRSDKANTKKKSLSTCVCTGTSSRSNTS